MEETQQEQLIRADSSNYVEFVLGTESVDFPMIQDRMARPALYKEVHDLLHQFYDLSVRVDYLKKALFYNKVQTADDGTRVLSQGSDVLSRMQQTEMIRLLHSIAGMITETGEIVEWYKSFIYDGNEIDWTKLSKEIGDGLWYAGIATDVQSSHTGKSFEDILSDNINKLRARYPKGFTNHHAINRAANDV